jgi:hypothetical protein
MGHVGSFVGLKLTTCIVWVLGYSVQWQDHDDLERQQMGARSS